MVYMESQPGTVIVSANYLHSVEDRSVMEHDKWIDAEVRALTAEEELKESWQRLADAELKAVAERAARQVNDVDLDLEVKWRSRFIGMSAVLVVVLWLVLALVVMPHWQEIEGWFR